MIMLMIEGQNSPTGIKVLGFFAILLFVSLAVSLNYKSFEEKTFLNQLVNPATGEINENLAELLWVSCRQDLNSLKEAFEDPKQLQGKTPSTTNGVNAKDDSVAQEYIRKLINILYPQLKQAISDCIKKNNLPLEISGEDDGFTTCCTRYFESLYHLPDVSRRILATESTGNDGSNTIIIACVVTAGVTFAIALCFFLCYRGSGVELNDEWPLLSLRISEPMTEPSGGSSDAYAFGSINEWKLESSGNESSLDKDNSYIKSDALQTSLNGKFGAVDGAAEASAKLSGSLGYQNSPLPMPPERVTVVTAPPGLPLLKPPPGRADPLSPEPPAPIKSSTPPPPHASITASLLPPAAMMVGPPPPAPNEAGPPPPHANIGPRPPGPPPPPLPYGVKHGVPTPPPPPNSVVGPRPPPLLGGRMPRPVGAPQWTSGSGDSASAPKAKLKPFFWDKVAADPDTAMVWNQIKAGSFQFNEEMIETLFGFAAVDKNKDAKKKESSNQEKLQYIQLIDAKKAQNVSILLKALNVTTEEVCDALREGNELPYDLLQTLLKMAPTQEEELKLRLFDGELSKLGTAERFLKALVDIPFAYKRMEIMLFMCSVYEDVTLVRESFHTLEVACRELTSSRLFLKLLEAVLKTGNRMNDGTFRGGAQAFKLDTLLKLSDVKGVDGKITLLHFVVQEIIRTEGLRAARVARESKSFTSIKYEDLLEDVLPDTEEHYHTLGLQVVSRLSSELENVKKAAAVDPDNLTGTVARLGHTLLKTRDFLNSEMKSSEEESGFHETLKSFVQGAGDDIMSLLEEEKKVMALVKSTGDYFHGNVKKDEGLRLFSIVRDFLKILDKVCLEIKAAALKKAVERKKQDSKPSTPSESCLPPDPCQKISPAIAEWKVDDSSSSSSSVSSSSSHVESAPRKTSTAHKRQVSNDCAPFQSFLPPNPCQKVFTAIALRKVDDSSSCSSSSSDNEGTPVNKATAHIRQLHCHVPSDPCQKVFPAIAVQKVDDSSSGSSSSSSSDDEATPVSTATANIRQVLSRLPPDPHQKVFPAIVGQKVDDSSSSFSSDDESTPVKTVITHNNQVLNTPSSSESRLPPVLIQKVFPTIAGQKVDDSRCSSDFASNTMNTATAHIRQLSNASSSSECHLKPPSPDPLQKASPAIAERKVDDSGSSSDDESVPMKTASAQERQVSNASSFSDLPTDLHQKVSPKIAARKVNETSSSSDDESSHMKTGAAHKRQVSNASSSSESHLKPLSPDPFQKVSPAIAKRKADDSGSSSEDESVPMKTASAHERQVSNASSSSESFVPPYPHEKIYSKIAGGKVNSLDDESFPMKTGTEHKRQVSSASSESHLKPPSPDPFQKVSPAINERKVDDLGSTPDNESALMNTESALVRQVSDASSSSESYSKPPSPDPLQKLFPTIAEQVDGSSSFSNDESAAMKTTIEHERQVSNVSSSSESQLKSPLDFSQKLLDSIAELRVDDSSFSSDGES